MRFRTKYWYLLCGANCCVAMFSAMIGSNIVLLALPMALASWHYAEHLLKQESKPNE